MSTRREAMGATLSLASGAALAAIPPAVLAISANSFPIAGQGTVAAGVIVATFVGQLASGWIVESRLASIGTSRSVATPRWLVVLGIASSLVLLVGGSSVIAVVAALPALFAALEVGRAVAVVTRAPREVMAGVVLGIGAAVAVLGAVTHLLPGFLVLGVSAIAAIVIRETAGRERTDPPNGAVRLWVTADVAFTGVTFPVLATVLLTMIGPSAAAAFAAVSTVSGLLSVPLNYLRMRLLKVHSVSDIVLTASILALAVVAIFVADATGVFTLLFGAVWSAGIEIPLVVACLWRGATLLSAIPFAALRRGGHARVATLVRGCSALLTAGLSVLASLTHELMIVFGALLVGELVLAAACEVARRLTVRPEVPA